MTWRLAVVLYAAVLLVPNHAAGQRARSAASGVPDDSVIPADSGRGASPTRRPLRPASRVGLWLAGSVGGGGVLGTIPDGWVGLVGLRYHRLLVPGRYPAPASGTAVTLTYTADLVPFASVRIPKGSPPPTQSAGIRSVTEHGLSTRGVGAYPLGLRVAAFPTAALRPFVAGHTGLFYLLDALPDERGRRTNFAVGVGVGLKVALSPRTTLTLGYRYHHLSNGFRGRINPGLDANLLYLGIDTAP